MAGAAARNPVAIRTPRPAARLRLFCFPYAGAGAGAYRDWPELLPSDIEVAAVQLPGREWRIQEDPLLDMRELAADALQAIKPMLDKPFALLGISMGGTLIFELARLLRESGGPLPVCLMPLAIGAPHLPETKLFHNLPDDELIAEVSNFGVLSEEVTQHPELLEMLLPVLRADCTAHETYSYADAEPFDFPIWVYAGYGDELITRERLDAWSMHTSAASRVHMLPGGHLFVDEMPDLLIQSMARRLYESLQLATS
jgi:medium-chain acyl-[acyl-carrier-protein] hydrolase